MKLVSRVLDELVKPMRDVGLDDQEFACVLFCPSGLSLILSKERVDIRRTASKECLHGYHWINNV